MDTASRKRGRPKTHPHYKGIRLREVDLERLERLKREWGCSEAEVFRRLLEGAVQDSAQRDAAQVEAGRLAAIDAAYGALADLPFTVDDFLREKHEEARREEERDRRRWEQRAG